MQSTVIQKIHTFTYIHKNESKHSEMGPVRQNPIQRPVRSVHMCVYCIVHNYIYRAMQYALHMRRAVKMLSLRIIRPCIAEADNN